MTGGTYTISASIRCMFRVSDNYLHDNPDPENFLGMLQDNFSREWISTVQSNIIFTSMRDDTIDSVLRSRYTHHNYSECLIHHLEVRIQEDRFTPGEVIIVFLSDVLQDLLRLSFESSVYDDVANILHNRVAQFNRHYNSDEDDMSTAYDDFYLGDDVVLQRRGSFVNGVFSLHMERVD